MSKFKDSIEEKSAEDLYEEHDMHSVLIPDLCSECYKDNEELTAQKRQEEADEADRDYEASEDDSYGY